MDANKPRRRWFRFSLRTLFVAVTLLCVWLGINVHEGRRQQEIVATVLANQGVVYYDYQEVFPCKPGAHCFDPNKLPWEPAWLQALLGRDFFHSVISVSIRGQAISHEDLEQLSALSDLQSLALARVTILSKDASSTRPLEDDDLKILLHLSNLDTLDLTSARLTSAGLLYIERLDKLRALSLWNTSLDDDGISHLQHLHNLVSLFLDGTNVTDEGLRYLKDLSNLETWLGLAQTQITDAGLSHLRQLRKLKQLNLIGTQVTESGAREIRPFLAPGATISLRP